MPEQRDDLQRVSLCGRGFWKSSLARTVQAGFVMCCTAPHAQTASVFEGQQVAVQGSARMGALPRGGGQRAVAGGPWMECYGA